VCEGYLWARGFSCCPRLDIDLLMVIITPNLRCFGGVLMKNKAVRCLLVLVGLLTVSLPLVAHHGNAQYENKVVTLKGTVTEWTWINPHVFLKFDVKDDQGKVVNWVCELVPPSTMVNFGFTAKTFQPGDQVTVVTSQVAKNGAPVARLGYDPRAAILQGGRFSK
jgi:hypothetical protein